MKIERLKDSKSSTTFADLNPGDCYTHTYPNNTDVYRKLEGIYSGEGVKAAWYNTVHLESNRLMHTDDNCAGLIRIYGKFVETEREA